MHEFDLILTLTGGLVAAFVGGYITQRLHLSPIAGYLAAGILVGPYTPGFVADRALAEQLAEFGVILLMFGVGLQFHVEDLNPSVHILARATHLREAATLRAAGADVVVSGEGEVALALTESILHRLGATPDQIDRERQRVRGELRT
jgi:predicted Kef-type K+ transport protein